MELGSDRGFRCLGLLLVLVFLVSVSHAHSNSLSGPGSGALRALLNVHHTIAHSSSHPVGSGLVLGHRQSNDWKSQNPMMLPTNVQPIHYNLTLEPNWTEGTFSGRAVIDVDVKEGTKEITLNSRDLSFINITLWYKDGESWKTFTNPNVNFNFSTDFTTLDFPSIVPPGPAVLDITYIGTLYNDGTLAGFYVSKYELPGNRTGKYAVTQFEAAHARRAFPSWDEPAIKTPVTITLVASKNYVCLSNMDVIQEETLEPRGPNATERKAVMFRTTPPISTYLVAWAIGELDYYETNQFRIPIRVYVPPSQDKKTAQFSADLAANAMVIYEQELGVQFPLPKLDFLSVTEYALGGMENWGLITMSSSIITVEKGMTRGIDVQRVAEVLVHELGHMWFGDLVGPEWWSQIWLNEGFAEYFANYIQQLIFPEWYMDQEFVAAELGVGLARDGLLSTHPIEVSVLSSRDAEYIFDEISYEKGASVLAMIVSWLGHDDFFGGLRDYLQTQAFGSAVTEELWTALSSSSEKNVTAKLDAWTKQSGFPIVTVSENGCELTLEQHRFLLRTGNADADARSEETVWPVPLGLRTKQHVDREIWLTERKATVVVSDEEFYLINANYSGVFRVLYPPERLIKLTRAAGDGQLTAQELIGLAADVCVVSSTATATAYPVTACLEFLSAIARSQSKSHIVWEAVGSYVELVQTAWASNATVREALQSWKLKLFRPMLEIEGWTVTENESVAGERLKVLLFQQAGFAGDDKVVATANDVFEKLASGDYEAYDEAMWKPAIAITLRHGNMSKLDTAWKMVENSPPNYNDSPVWLRSFVLDALFAPMDANLTNSTLSRLTDMVPTTTLGVDEIVQIFAGAIHTYGIAPMIFNWLRDDGMKLLAAKGQAVAVTVLWLTVELLSARPELDMARQWLAGLVANGTIEETTTIDLLAILETRVRWAETDGAKLEEYLRVNVLM